MYLYYKNMDIVFLMAFQFFIGTERTLKNRTFLSSNLVRL